MSILGTEYFKLNEDHLRLIRQMNVGYNEYCEFGAPEIDPKRPYGNGDVYRDIAKILEIEPVLVKDGEEIFSNKQEETMLALHKETAKALQVVLSSGSFKPGTYESEKYHDNWSLVK